MGTYVSSSSFTPDPLASHVESGMPAQNLWFAWNQLVTTTTTTVDVVLHLHGYRPGAATRATLLNHATAGKVLVSGLDGTLDNYASPLVAIVPAGKNTQFDGDSSYQFPFLDQHVAAGGTDNLTLLIQSVLGLVATQVGATGTLSRGRLIVTSHSGGGFAMGSAIHVGDPHELYYFDATYGSPSARLGTWIETYLTSAPSPPPPSRSAGDRFLRVVYGGSGTGSAIPAIKVFLRRVNAGRRTQGWVHRYHSPTVIHELIPRDYTPLLLANPQDDFSAYATATATMPATTQETPAP